MKKTIVESNKKINQLIVNKHFEVKYPYRDQTYTYTLEKGKIFCDGYPLGISFNTIDKWMYNLGRDAMCAHFIEMVLNAVGITISNIEKEYDVLSSSINGYFEICKRVGDHYIFIELNSYSSDNIDTDDIGKYIRFVEFDLTTKDLSFDRIDLERLKHYHADGKISEYTSRAFSLYKNRSEVSNNDLYDVIAEGVPKSEYNSPYASMNNYGELVGDIDVDKLDKKVCKVYKKSDGFEVKY